MREQLTEASVIDSSERDPSYLLRTRNGRFVKLSSSAHFLLSQVDAGVSTADLARQLSQQLGRAVTGEEVDAAYRDVRRRVEQIENRQGRPSTFGLWWRAPCLPAPAVAWLTRRLAVAFHPVGVFLLCGALAWVVVRNWPAATTPPADAFDIIPLFWPTFGLLAVSMLAHELGHASACAHYRVPTREIGFGLYWVYPVFYSDVSEAWTLNRRQRVVVDLGGVFFQLLAGAAYLELYRHTGWEPARIAFVGTLSIAIFILVPIFKFDGYWLMSDALGVVNLSRQIRRVAVHLVARARRQPVKPLPWPGRTTAIVAVYSVATVAFFGYFLYRVVPGIVAMAATYPARIGGLARDLLAPPHQLADGRLQSVAFSTYMLFGLTLALVGLLRPSLRSIRRLVRRRGAR
jgi:putative peptide zinc metalloprotease protein